MSKIEEHPLYVLRDYKHSKFITGSPDDVAHPPPRSIVGCLLDVSGSMREALESDGGDEQALERFRAILSAALQLAKAEERRDPNALMFIGAFGFREKDTPVVDLCQLIDALLGDEESSETGYDLLIRLANEYKQDHITKYIHTKLTEDEARIIYVYLQRHPECTKEFVEAIPPPVKFGRLRTLHTSFKVLGGATGAVMLSLLQGIVGSWAFFMWAALVDGGTYAGDSIAEAIEDDAMGKSKAMGIARRICREWLQEYDEFGPCRAGDVFKLLEKLQDSWAPRNDNPESESESESKSVSEPNTLVERLRKYMYGQSPMQKSLNQYLEVFRTHSGAENRVLVLLSDGSSTDGDPLPVARELQQENVVIATIYLTSNQDAAHRSIYDQAAEDWSNGQKTLYEMAEKASCCTHPISVLETLGWKVPPSGEAALFANVCSTTDLEEFFLALLSTRFRSADALLEIASRVRLDEYVNDERVRSCKNPSEQEESGICFAHTAAFVLYSALRGIVGRTEGYPHIEDIRQRILQSFAHREHGHNFEIILEEVIKWYSPLRFRKVNKDGARQAVLQRRPVLTTFRLSRPGWDAFCGHFDENAITRTTLLTKEKMKPYHDQPDGGGHAVALVSCDPYSLTFLNCWGEQWGNGGSFSIEDTTVLKLTSSPSTSEVCFYDVYCLEDELNDEERKEYERQVEQELEARSQEHRSILDLEYCCPLCGTSSAIANFRGNIYCTVCPCPDCGESFKPEPGYLAQALYVRAGLGTTI